MLALAPATVANGCLRVIKRSHTLGRLAHLQYGSQRQADPERMELVHAAGMEEVACELAPGDMLYYHGNMLHASDANLSDTSRWSIIFGWALESNPVVDTPDPTHAFVPLEDAEVGGVIAAHEARLASRPRL